MSTAWDRRMAHAAMLLTQVNFGANPVVVKVALSDGVNKFVFCFYRNLVALVILGFPAFFKERKIRPSLPRTTPRTMFMFFILGATGIFGNQLLFTLGLNLSSPEYAAGMQPATPTFTSLFALFWGTEVLNWHRVEGKAKVSGILMCIAGAFFMLIYTGPVVLGDASSANVNIVHAYLSYTGIHSAQANSSNLQLATVPMKTWLESGIIFNEAELGILCLILCYMCMAIYFVLQADLLVYYPCALLVTAWSSLFGTVLLGVAAAFSARNCSDWTLTWLQFSAVMFSGCVTSALNYALMTWSNMILGPSMVGLYVPLQAVAADILCLLFMGSPIFLGSILGACMMIIGMYLVSWSQRQPEPISMEWPSSSDSAADSRSITISDDKGLEQPLLLGQEWCFPTPRLLHKSQTNAWSNLRLSQWHDVLWKSPIEPESKSTPYLSIV